MGSIEKDLKTLQKEMTGKYIFLESDTSIKMPELRRLQAHGLIELKSYADNLLRISLTDEGEFYDDFKNEKRKAWFSFGLRDLIIAVSSAAVVQIINVIFNN